MNKLFVLTMATTVALGLVACSGSVPKTDVPTPDGSAVPSADPEALGEHAPDDVTDGAADDVTDGAADGDAPDVPETPAAE